jgi:Sulfotransferase family
MNRYVNLFAWYANKLFDHPFYGIPPIIVSGVGRSGTTALRMSLGEHPGIVYNQAENNILMDLLVAGLHNCTYPSRKASMQMGQERYDKAFRNLILNVLYPRPRFSLKTPTHWMALSDITPRLAQYLKQLFPKARIVYIVRNGIEVVSSRMVFEGFKNRPFNWQCEVWAKAEETARWGQQQDNFFLIRHETLLDQDTTARVFDELWTWLGLKNDFRCVEALWSKSYHPTILSSEDAGTSADLRQRTLRWKYWNEEQRQIFASRCAAGMQYFGYEIPWEFQ